MGLACGPLKALHYIDKRQSPDTPTLCDARWRIMSAARGLREQICSLIRVSAFVVVVQYPPSTLRVRGLPHTWIACYHQVRHATGPTTDVQLEIV